MAIRPEEVSSVIKQQIEEYIGKPRIAEVGSVISVGDGIARVYGLEKCLAGELLSFAGGVHGMVMNLEEDNIGCVLLGESEEIVEGSEVKRTGQIASMPVGEAYLGRVVNPLGEVIDGGLPVKAAGSRPVEYHAPGIVDRSPVSQPLETGIVAIDSMIPIGRGQRELIIGDRQTGKTAIAIDTIINQKGKDVICIYVSIGQKASTIASVHETLKQHGCMEYTTIVASTASDLSSLQYLAPYSGCALGEYFMYDLGKDVLIIYDDLSKHAVAYRALSLLLRRPPGREAFPGDVFYLHSRLLERAAKLNDKLGGGSMTALPIVETQAGDISAYIPTNVISITDGQIYLESELFNSGQRPAVNVGLSVSRVGGSAQTKAMKKIAGPLRLNLAQYRELSVFMQFGSDLDKSTRDRLLQGERLTECIKQPQYTPYSMIDQIILLTAAMGGFMMNIEVRDVKNYASKMINYVKANCVKTVDSIVKSTKMTDEQQETLTVAISEFTDSYIHKDQESEQASAHSEDITDDQAQVENDTESRSSEEQ